MQKCWEHDPESRPIATKVFRTLDNYFSKLQSPQQCEELKSFLLQESRPDMHNASDLGESDEESSYSQTIRLIMMNFML